MSYRTTRRGALRLFGAGALVGLPTVTTTASGDARVFVHPGEGRSRAEAAIRAHGGAVLVTYDHFDFVAARVPLRSLDDLRGDGRVARVEDDGRVHAIHHREGHGGGPGNGGGGDDTGGCGDHPSQQGSWGWDRIDADLVTGATGAGVGVAILDTGIDTDHCDLDVTGGYNATGRGNGFDDKNGHGSHCAGIAAALDNGVGVVGAAPDANLYAVKVLDNGGSGYWSWIVAGVDWCMTHGREVLSMSFGASSMPAAASQAMSDASAAGHLLVSSAGNSGNDRDGGCEEDNVGMPARHPDVVAVSAMDEGDLLASYSSVGPAVEIMAPGTSIRSTYAGDGYATLSGTSMACPHVGGVAALVWEAAGASLGSGGNATVRSLLSGSAETVLGTCEEGSGLLDAEAAVDAALAG